MNPWMAGGLGALLGFGLGETLEGMHRHGEMMGPEHMHGGMMEPEPLGGDMMRPEHMYGDMMRPMSDFGPVYLTGEGGNFGRGAALVVLECKNEGFSIFSL